MLTTDIYNKPLSDAFKTAIESYAQKVKPKVVITFLDSRHTSNASISITNDSYSNTSKGSAGYFFSANQLINGVERQTFSWAVCDDKDVNGKTITADGVWCAMPSDLDDNYEMGWRSNSKSTTNNNVTYGGYDFTSTPILTYTFDQRKVNKIRITTSDYSGQIHAYRLQAYTNTTTNVLDVYSNIPDGSYYRDHIIPTTANTYDINKIVLTVLTTKNPSDNARINEIVPLYEVDITDYVTNYNVERTRDLHETSLPIAGTATASSSISLDNTLKDFNAFDSSSKYGPYMKKDLKVNIYTGWRIVKTDNILVNTRLSSSMTNSALSMTVSDASGFLNGNTTNTFTLTIAPGTTSEEMVLCSSRDDRTVTIVQRGYNNTPAVAHNSNDVVTFDPYEYINSGEFYIDEWSGSSEMEVTMKLMGKDKFLTEKQITKGFLVENSTVGDAVLNLLMMSNFPQKQYSQLLRYTDFAKTDSIASYSFSEPSQDASGTSITVANGLRFKFWAIEDGRQNEIKDIPSSYVERELTEYDKAIGGKTFITPTFSGSSTSICSNTSMAVDLSSYTFTSNSITYSSYYNGVIEGFYIPKTSGNQDIILKIAAGGVRAYLDETLIISAYNASGTYSGVVSASSNTTLGGFLDLDAGVPYKLRIEFYHTHGSFTLQMFKKLSGGLEVQVPATECATLTAYDSVGSRNSSWGTVLPRNTITKTISGSNGQYTITVSPDNTGIYINSSVSGTNIGANAVVTSISGTTIRLSVPNTGTVSGTGTFVDPPYRIDKNLKNRNHYRNDGLYLNTPILNQTGGLISEPNNKSIYLTSNAYVRIPNNESINITKSTSTNYSSTFTIEIYGKFPSTFAGDGEYLSCWNNSTSTTGFEFFNTSASNGFKIKKTNGTTLTVSSNTALPTSSYCHIAVSHDGGQLYYYVNGVLQGQTGGAGNHAEWSNDITIGGRGASYTSGTGEVAPTTFRSFYIDEFAIYNKYLTSDQIKNRYISTQIKELTKFPYLYGNEDSVKGIIDKISLADFGRFYIDETNTPKYEFYNKFFETSIDQHANVQKTLSSDTNLISGNYTVQLQVNKVTVNVTSQNDLKSKLQNVWTASPDPSSLTAVLLKANIGLTDTSISVSSTVNPPFADSGYLIIDNEIVKYTSKNSNTFLGVERGLYDTVATTHTTGTTTVRECRVYDIVYDSAPILDIKLPFITASQYYNPAKIKLIKFKTNPYTAQLIIAASTSILEGEYVYIQGTNPLSDEVEFTSIAGIPVIKSEGSNQVKSQSASFSDDIRKYGLKEVVIDNEYINTATKATELAEFLKSKLNQPIPILEVETVAIPTIQAGDRVRISNLTSMGITNKEYWVISHNLSYSDTISQNITLRQITS